MTSTSSQRLRRLGGELLNLKGLEEPRLWTRPLRPLTPETSHGFHVIEFAARFLGVRLRPWQRWLLIHALELREDGRYRFRRVILLVGRQNGKTTLLKVLAAWWLFVDSDSFPEHVPAHKFLVLGVAQNLDVAEETWEQVRVWCDPHPDPDAADLALPVLQRQTAKIVAKNGQKSVVARSGASYAPRAAHGKAARGKSVARAIVDELREQRDWSMWAGISKTCNGTFNSQLWGVSNAGDVEAVVLRGLRGPLVESVKDWVEYVEKGLQSVEEFASSHDMTQALFEWSAPEDCALDDEDGIRQANPSIGYGMDWETVLTDLDSDPDSLYRTEVLCQFVTADVEPFIPQTQWMMCSDAPEVGESGEIVVTGSQPAEGGRLVLGADINEARTRSYLSVAGFRDDGLVHGEVVAARAGMMWLPEVAGKIARRWGIREFAVQARGAAVSELVAAFEREGLSVHLVGGTALGGSAGMLRDLVRDEKLRHRSQPVLDMSASGSVSKRAGDMEFLDRRASMVDAAALISLSMAVWGLHQEPLGAVVVSAYAEQGEWYAEDDSDADESDWWEE